MQLLGTPALLGLGPVLDPEFGKKDMALAGILLVALLMLAGLAGGLIVVAGAVKMRKLQSYRLCRPSSILAMLPLGFGFVLGLPFGIWALLVLRRTDVQAAFEGKQGGGHVTY